jgi:hypothetical protein
MMIRFIRNLSPVFDDNSPDEAHPHRRRFTKKYRAKKALVMKMWLVMGLLIALFPMPHLMISLALLGALISFVLLDETS